MKAPKAFAWALLALLSLPWASPSAEEETVVIIANATVAADIDAVNANMESIHNKTLAALNVTGDVGRGERVVVTESVE